jgi:hypothetical protein
LRSPVRRQALAGGIIVYLVWVALLQPSWAQAVSAWPVILSAWCALNVAAGVYWLRALLGEWKRIGAGAGEERPQTAVKASVA